MTHPIETFEENKAYNLMISTNKVSASAIRISQSLEEYLELINHSRKTNKQLWFNLKLYLLKLDYKVIGQTFDPNDEEWINEYKTPMIETYNNLLRTYPDLTLKRS